MKKNKYDNKSITHYLENTSDSKKYILINQDIIKGY